ncbi:MAG: hypothetical protein DMG96_19840, partial [Acidobacteria bacterium]
SHYEQRRAGNPYVAQRFKTAWDRPMKGARIESKADLEECIVCQYSVDAYAAGRGHHHAGWESLPSERLHAQLLPQAARWPLAARSRREFAHPGNVATVRKLPVSIGQ